MMLLNPVRLALAFAMFAIASSRRGEVCFPFDSDSPQPPADGQPVQGRPGKIGPVGPQGQKGEQGDAGPSGQCACIPNEVEQLRREIETNKEVIDKVAFFAEAFIRKDRVAACGVGMKDGRVLDSDITASSVYGSHYPPYEGRLDRPFGNGKNGAWLGCRTCSVFIVMIRKTQ